VNANDPNSFIAKGISLAKKDDLQNIRINARKTTLEISWDKVTKKLEESYQEFLNRSHLKNKIPSSIALREFVIKQ
jgi:glycosyltransferase involved in cell wall biosynthesis